MEPQGITDLINQINAFMKNTTTQHCERSSVFVLSLTGKLWKLNNGTVHNFSSSGFSHTFFGDFPSGELKMAELILRTTKPDSEFQNSIGILNLPE